MCITHLEKVISVLFFGYVIHSLYSKLACEYVVYQIPFLHGSSYNLVDVVLYLSYLYMIYTIYIYIYIYLYKTLYKILNRSEIEIRESRLKLPIVT